MRDSVTIGIIFSALSFIVTNTYSALHTTWEHVWENRDQHVEEMIEKKGVQMECKEVPSDN